jgi:Flp pilus assembly protein TadD
MNVDACVSTDDPRKRDAATVGTETTVICAACSQTEETRIHSSAAAAATLVYERQPEINTHKIREPRDACLSTNDLRTCDAATVSTETTVMCAACSQTEETRIDSGAAAATQVYERQPEINTHKIREPRETCVSTNDQRSCDAATVSAEPTVMCAACSQTEETRMNSGAAVAAATQVYERQPEINTHKIREPRDACLSTEDPRTCDAATMSTEPTVMCAACSQT